MNQEVFAGQWKQMQGKLKSWWGKLVESNVDKSAGQKSKLVALVQKRNGYAREPAQPEVGQHSQESNTTTSHPSNARRDAERADVSASALTSHVGPIATTMSAVENGVESVQGAIVTGLESAQGALSTAANAVADGVGSASSYLQEKKFDELTSDLTNLIHNYPVPALLVSVGLGYILGRLTTR